VEVAKVADYHSTFAGIGRPRGAKHANQASEFSARNRVKRRLTVLDKSLREECGVFAVCGHEAAAELTFLGLHALQHRGQESAGIVAIDERGETRIRKGMGLVAEAIKAEDISELPGSVAIGHARYSTTGESELHNAQPALVKYRDGTLALAHNGNLTNAAELRTRLVAEGSIFQSTMDSEVIVHLIARSQQPDPDRQVLEALTQVEGAFSLAIIINDTVYAARDPRGFRPLVLGRKGPAVIVASATAISRVVGLGREVLTAGLYGVTADYNTYVSVSVVPNLIRQLFADAAISAAFVPVLTALLAAGDVERARRLGGTLLGFMLAVVGAVCVVLILAATPVVRAIYPELTATSRMTELAAHYLQILVPTVLVLALAGVLTGVLYAHERFTMPAVVSIVWNLVIIAFMAVWHGSWGVYALAWGTLAGTVVELVLLVFVEQRRQPDRQRNEPRHRHCGGGFGGQRFPRHALDQPEDGRELQQFDLHRPVQLHARQRYRVDEPSGHEAWPPSQFRHAQRRSADCGRKPDGDCPQHAGQDAGRRTSPRRRRARRFRRR